MELWLDLLFKNPVGLSSVVVIGLTFVVMITLASILVKKSRK